MQASAELLSKTRKFIEANLDFVTSHWSKNSYSLWEELFDQNFFTEIVQRKALILGANFEQQLGDKEKTAQYLKPIKGIEKLLNQHWNFGMGYFTAALYNQEYKGGNMNSSVIMGALLANTNNPNDTFTERSDKMLSTAFFIRNIFANLYLINLNNSSAAPLIGRYVNDKYDGNNFIYGNPWFLTSNYLAQFYYTVAKQLLTNGQISITPINIHFFQQINPELFLTGTGLITSQNDPKLFNTIISSLIQAGDSILLRVKQYSTCIPNQGCLHLSEQIDRANGQQVSAKDLTWSYVSLLTALQACENLINQLAQRKLN